MNYAAIDRGMEDVQKVEIPAEWINAVDDAAADKVAGEGALVEYVNGILKPVNAYKGNKLPVSAFSDHPTAPLPLKREASRLTFPSGSLRIVSSVTAARSFVRTLLSVPLR